MLSYLEVTLTSRAEKMLLIARMTKQHH